MLWIFISFKSCRLHEYFYSVLIFDYGILLGFPYIIINFMIDYMKIHRIFRIFFILLYQYLIIDMIVWIYVSHSKTYQDKYNEKKAFNEAWLYTLCFDSPLAFICYMVFIVDYIKDGIECLRKGFWQLFLILYVPIMILGYILLAFVIKEDYIYCFIFEIFFILLFLSIYTFIVKEDVITIYKLFFICLVSNIITLIPFYFIFIKDGMTLLYISLCILGVDIYLCGIYFITNEKIYTEDDEYINAIIVFDYSLFFLGIVLACIVLLLPFILCAICGALGPKN